MSTSENIIAWQDPILLWRIGASEIVGEQAPREGAQQGTDPKYFPIRWDDPSHKWRFGASDIVGEEAAAEQTQQGTAAGSTGRRICWPEPWRLPASDIVSKEGSAVEGTQQGTDPERTPILWHGTPLRWCIPASEIVGGEASAAPPPPVCWPEPWRLPAADIVSKEGSAVEGTQQGTGPERTPILWHGTPLRWCIPASEIVGGGASVAPPPPVCWPEPWRLPAADIVSKEGSAVEGTQQGTDPERAPILWHGTPLRWRIPASEFVGGEAPTAPPPPVCWPEPWRLPAADIVSKEASAVVGTQQGTGPERAPILWHGTPLRWRIPASEIVGGEASVAPPPPVCWHEPWRLGAPEIIGKEASAEGTQKTASD